MKVGIHYDFEYIVSDFVKQFIEILEYNDIAFRIMDSSSNSFWEDLNELDLFIYHFGNNDISKDRAMTFMPIIEEYHGIKCLPNYNTYWHYDDKIKQYFFLRSRGYPVAESWVFWERKAAMEFVESCDYPVIFKLRGGSNSNSVIKLDNKRQARKIVQLMFGSKGAIPGRLPSKLTTRYKYFDVKKECKNIGRRLIKPLIGRASSHNWVVHRGYAYFQRFYPNNAWDTRVTTIGDRTYAFRRFVRKNDFRASGSDDWSLDRSKIDIRMLKIAQQISSENSFQVMAYDFVMDENNDPVLIEISYCYGDYPEFHDGYWDKDLNWVEGSFSTQYLELVDALNMPDLKKPKLEATGHYARVTAKS